MCNIPGVWWIKLHNSPGLQICCCFGFIVLHLLSSFLFHLNANRCSGVVVFFKVLFRSARFAVAHTEEFVELLRELKLNQ